ncbi:MAG: 50S ribosomal protein L31 [Kiritimatiellia bacterium]|nr:50S ribosomal protein L31 [Kiritimatiellia bacterium]
MKADIHPKYGPAKITCACGNSIETQSTVKEMHINSCSRCHPFYTGQAKFMDTEGRVDRFRKRYAAAAPKA